MTRCDLCGLPMESEGQTGYCSERCLMWDFFGVPALKENDFVAEIRKNQRSTTAGRTERPEAYPALSGGPWQKEIREALALLKMSCNEIRYGSHE